MTDNFVGHLPSFSSAIVSESCYDKRERAYRHILLKKKVDQKWHLGCLPEARHLLSRSWRITEPSNLLFEKWTLTKVLSWSRSSFLELSSVCNATCWEVLLPSKNTQRDSYTPLDSRSLCVWSRMLWDYLEKPNEDVHDLIIEPLSRSQAGKQATIDTNVCALVHLQLHSLICSTLQKTCNFSSSPLKTTLQSPL